MDYIVNRLAHNYSPLQSGNSNYFYWGASNNLPQEMEDIIANNGFARKALGKLTEYIIGKGFEDVDFKTTSVNTLAPNKLDHNYKSVQSLFDEIAMYASFYDGAFALLIKRDKLAKVRAISVMDISKLRMVRGNDDLTSNWFAYNPYRGRSNDSKAHEVNLPRYSSQLDASGIAQLIADQKKQYGSYQGEVFYHYNQTIGVPYYPIPQWFSSSELILANSKTFSAFFAKASNLFMPSAVLSVPKMDDTRDGHSGVSEKDLFMNGIKQRLNSNNPPQLMVLEGQTSGALPQITSLDTADLPAAIVGIAGESTRLLFQLFDVDPALCGFTTAGQLGNNQQLAISEGMLNERAAAIRAGIMFVLEPFLELLNIKIEPKILDRKQYNAIPDQFLDTLTVDERRALIGYDPIKTIASATATTTLEILNTMSPLVATKILESLTQNQKLALIGLPPLPEPINPTEDAILNN